jgi:hypothetical protein
MYVFNMHRYLIYNFLYYFLVIYFTMVQVHTAQPILQYGLLEREM